MNARLSRCLRTTSMALVVLLAVFLGVLASPVGASPMAVGENMLDGCVGTDSLNCSSPLFEYDGLYNMAGSDGPTIASDAPDYTPGSTVILTGAGWSDGEAVNIFVNDDAGQSWNLESDPDPVADASGAFTFSFQLPAWFVANYSVTATGPVSGVATTTFTDMAVGTYDQCSNDTGEGFASGDTGCRWINGNLNSSNSFYTEGDATVQRLWLEDFTPGSTHTVTFEYGTTRGGDHAYDFLTTWNWSEDWITLADRCQSITGCTTANETTFAIPVDPNAAGFDAATGTRLFTMRGGTITAVSTPTITSGDYTGNSETAITVTFTVASSGSMCPTTGPKAGTCAIALWFGAHVATQADWGNGNGAGSISGSPYHVSLNAVDGASAGSRDNQMSAGTVTQVPNGTIVIVKDAVPNDPLNFDFNLTNGTTINQNFSLDDDGDPTLPNSQTFSVPQGMWTATEILPLPVPWSLTNIVCVDPSNNTTVNIPAGTATIDLASSETVTCTYTNTFVSDPALNVTKSSTTTTITGAGQVVPYTFTVEDTGNVSLTNITVTDPNCDATPAYQSGDNAPLGVLDVDETWTYTCSHTVTQAEIDAATGPNPQLHNMVTADSAETGPDTDDLDIPIDYDPALNVTKSSTTTTITAAGQVVPYTFSVTNTGNVTLTNVMVSDPKCTSAVSGPTGDTNNDDRLDKTETWVFTCTHTVTLAEMNAGSNLPNTVTADSTETGPDTDDYSIPIQQDPELTLDKTTTTVSYDTVGYLIDYTYLVTNDGNVPLTPPYAVTDNKATVTCPQSPDPLLPGDFITCEATHTVTQADIDAGSVTNVATATAKYGNQTVTSNQDTVTVPAQQDPALTLEKTSPTANYDSVGDVIQYSYKVTNSGNVSLTAPYAVSDNKTTVTCPQTPSPLMPDAFITCSASYIVTQADLDAGSVTNVATATAKYGNQTVTSNQDQVTVPGAQDPLLTLVKTTSTPNYDSVGDVIVYSYLVTNEGNVSLTPPYAVNDNKATVDCPQTPDPLVPGASITCSASYTVTQADITAGSVTNVATATAKHGNQTVTSNQDTQTVPAVQLPALALDKSTTTVNYDSVGDIIAYAYKVTNSGNVPLNAPYAVNDDVVTVNCPQTPAPLNPGQFITCTAQHVVTQADLNAGTVVNTATATAKYGAQTVTSNEDTVTVPALQGPALTLEKSTTTANYDSVGDVIAYSYKVTNSGNVSLTPPYAVSDDQTTVDCPQTPDPLVPGQFITCSATYTVTQADINAGAVVNVATATAKHGSNTITSNEDSVTVPAVQLPALTLDKSTTTANYDSVGDVIQYSYLVTNSGNVPLTPPYAVSDDKATVNCPQTPAPLNPGVAITCTATHSVTQADLNAGSVVNVATATAKYGNDTLTSNQDSVTVPALQNPALTLDKSTTTVNYDSVGDIIAYAYKVTNSGNVPLEPPYAVNDNKATVNCPQTPDPLNPGQFITCTAQYVVTQADLNAGTVVNVAKATAIYNDLPVESNEDSVTVNGEQGPALTLEKSTTTANYDSVGDVIAYSYKVTNSGNVSLTPPYAVNDNKATVDCPQTPNPLNPGAFITCTASYTVTQADITAGSVVNIATATAKHGSNTVTSNEDSVTVPAVQSPALLLDKTTTTADYDAVGDTISYSYKVTNSGNVPLNPPYAVSDDKATVNCPQTPAPLNPGAFITCTATHTVTQADLNAGSVTNVAVASALYGTAPVQSNQDSTTVPAVQLPALSLDKTTPTASFDSVGDVIQYSYKVTNSGNVSLTPPYAVTDDRATVTCPQTPNPLNPGAFITCTASYIVTQVDINTGSVTNVATATAKHGNNTVTSNEDTVTVPATQGPALSLDKSTTTASFDSVGDVIQYSYKVTNSGNVALTPPYAVSDNKTTVTCPQTPNPLNPGAFITCSASYIVTQADLNAGSVVNVATATAKHGNNTVTSNEDTVTVPAAQGPALTLVKSTTTVDFDAVGDVINYTYVATNSGNVSLTPPYAVSDNKIAAVTCQQTPNPLLPGASFTCTASYTVVAADLTAGEVVNVATATAKHGANTVTSNEDTVTVPVAPPSGNCPAEAGNNWTDILGIGMGNTTTHKAMAKVVIPNSSNVTELYGQMAAKQVGLAKFVRFLYPNSTYEQVNAITSPASQVYGVFWYGTELDRAAHIRGRWFLQKTGVNNHIPRALILYPTYTDPTRQWVNVFETLDAADTQVYWQTAGGWTQTQEVVIDIPAPLAATTFNVELALVDNDNDTRPIEVTVSAGNVSVMQSPTGPNRGALLNLMQFTLPNVPAGTDTITITIHSPSPNSVLLLGGDSAALTGVVANYECVEPNGGD